MREHRSSCPRVFSWKDILKNLGISEENIGGGGDLQGFRTPLKVHICRFVNLISQYICVHIKTTP